MGHRREQGQEWALQLCRGPCQSFQQFWHPPSYTQPCPSVCQHPAVSVRAAPGHGCSSGTQTVSGSIREEKQDENFTKWEPASKSFPWALLRCLSS